MSFKTLHTFTVTTKQMVPETTERIEDGKSVKVTADVERETKHTIVLKDPSRREKQDLALFQQVSFSDAVRKGLLTRAAMQRELARNSNDPVSPDDDKALGEMQVKLHDLANEIVKVGATQDSNTDEAKARREALLTEYAVLHKKVEDISAAYQSVYAHTAESYSQTKTLSWLTVFLTYTKVGDKTEPLFAGADFVARENRAGDMDDAADPLYRAVMEKLPIYWMLFLFNRASKTEDFVTIEAEWTRQNEAEAKLRETALKRENEGKLLVAPSTITDCIFTTEPVAPVAVEAVS